LWNRALAEAAEQHSVDMAARRYFDHVGPDGKRVSNRVLGQGYRWRVVGENLAGGDTTVAGVIAGWLGSPEHCENLMGPAYAEVGVSCVRQPGSQWGTYWTMVLAARR
nr:CAP domain-containing protein [Pseudomonadota bacterium]